MIKPKAIFHFKTPLQVKADWMNGLTHIELYNSIFNITKENIKFQLYTDPLDSEFSFTEMKDKIAELLDLSHFTPEDLEHKIRGPDIIKAYRELSIEESQTDGYYFLSMNYTQSSSRDFESYLRNLTGLNEDDFQLILKQYNSKFITYESFPGNYTFKDISEVLPRAFENEFEIRGEIQPNTEYDKSDSIIIECDNNTMKTKLIVRYETNALRFDEKSFFSTILGIPPYWDYKSHNEYVPEKLKKLSTIDKVHLKGDVIDGSIQNGLRQPILFSFVLDTKPGYKVFCEPETIHFKKINISVLNTITFYLEDDNKEEVNFNVETLTFTLQMIRF